MSKSHALQCAAFQLATHHTFHANKSSSFYPMADDNSTCPHCRDLWTMNHILFKCLEFWEPQGMILNPHSHNTAHHLFSSKTGRHQLIEFLHATQALLHPLLCSHYGTANQANATHLEVYVSVASRVWLWVSRAMVYCLYIVGIYTWEVLLHT